MGRKYDGLFPEPRRIEQAAAMRLEITIPHMFGRFRDNGFLVDETDEDEVGTAKELAREIAQRALDAAGEHVGEILDDLVIDGVGDNLRRNPNW